TILGDHTGCMNLAYSTQTGVMMRDAGYKWEVEGPILLASLNEAKGASDSFVKDDDDVKLVYDVFMKIWANNGTVEDTMNAVYTGCMKTHLTSVENTHYVGL